MKIDFHRHSPSKLAERELFGKEKWTKQNLLVNVQNE